MDGVKPVRKELAKYRQKRDFEHTSEPRGENSGAVRERLPVFVIQKHDASHLHYDFRLEVDGVLKSWAVPKGPSTNPREKRLAVQVEDHPFEYRTFEGEIPEGNYGAGEVIVWDQGSYRNLDSAQMSAGLRKGHIAVWLEGKKLKGGYALTRVGEGPKPRWILVKMRDSESNERTDITVARPESAVTGKTLAIDKYRG